MSRLSVQLPKRSKKERRELDVLLSVVELFIRTGKPIGSNTLKDAGFPELSSATIRNYFSHLEEEGYLHQAHASGGRTPTARAYQLFADENLDASTIDQGDEELLRTLRRSETRQIATFLQEAAETLSQITDMAVFLSAPRFDHDLIRDLKLVAIDSHRCLAVLVTDFGVIHTEVLHSDEELTGPVTDRLCAYFRWRFAQEKPEPPFTDEEDELGKALYNELMVRYIVGYSNFSNEDIHRTGFTRLLYYPEFNDAATLAGGLSLFENPHSMRLLLREATSTNSLRVWVGDQLDPYLKQSADCAVMAVPYRVQQASVGAVGLLGPSRVPYKELFGILRVFSEYVSETLTRSVCKFKISYREPESGQLFLAREEKSLVKGAGPIMLEDKRDGKRRKTGRTTAN